MRRGILLFSTCCAMAACELQEVTLTELDDLVVAEVLVQVRDDADVEREAPTAFALLHRTSGSESGVPGARIVVRTPRGPVELIEAPVSNCMRVGPPEYGRTCYLAPRELRGYFLPGDALTVEIALPDGGRLQGAAHVPTAFRLHNPHRQPAPHACLLAPVTTLDVRWSRSEGAWAYVAETALENFRDGFAARGIEVEVDDLYLLGLAISASDTTIVFPTQFGLIERLTTDRELMLALREGLPEGATASISVTAVDRNYTNWARGGTFNPSGQVRIPSLRGDGTGVFGATVVRTLEVIVPPNPQSNPSQLPACG